MRIRLNILRQKRCFDTLSRVPSREGEEGFVEHFSEEHHNDFIKYWEIIQEHNQKEISQFQIAVLNATSIDDI